MKAFLLAAGLGTRLRPLTYTLPKCLLPVGGEALLSVWFRLLREHRVTEVLLNTHYLPDTVERFLASCTTTGGLTVRTSYEPSLLGSAGTVRHHRAWVDTDAAFLICYADNLTDANLSALIADHRPESVLTMGLFRSDNPKGCGIAETDATGVVVGFVEKPVHPKSDWANAGLYVASPALFDYLSDSDKDFGRDVLPRLVGTMRGSRINGYLRDVGTVESYGLAQLEWYVRHVKPVG
jgi:mannose-1-phosphate guanylyltransferase